MRRIDDDDDRKGRFAGGNESDKRHVVIGMTPIAAVDQLLRRAGLSRHGVSGNLRRLAGALGHDAFHDLGERRRGFCGDGA